MWNARREAVWVIDGATSLAPSRFPNKTDASWFVEKLSDEISTAIEAESSLGKADLDLICSRLRRQFSIETQQLIDPSQEEPSASLSLVMVKNGCLQLFNIGDCRAYWWTAGSGVQRFGASNVERFDRKAIDLLVSLQKSSPESRLVDLWPEVRALILKNRRMANVDGGYYVARMSPDWLDHVERKKIALDQPVNVLICSDGFYRAIDTFGLLKPKDVPAALAREGIMGLARLVRERELDDPECRAYPRLKRSDDLTAVWVTFEDV